MKLKDKDVLRTSMELGAKSAKKKELRKKYSARPKEWTSRGKEKSLEWQRLNKSEFLPEQLFFTKPDERLKPNIRISNNTLSSRKMGNTKKVYSRYDNPKHTKKG